MVQQTAQDAATLLKNDGGALPLSARDLAAWRSSAPGPDRPSRSARPARTPAASSPGRPAPTRFSSQMTGNHPGTHLSYAVGDDMTGTPVPPPHCPITASRACCAPTTATSPPPSSRGWTTPPPAARLCRRLHMDLDRRPDRGHGRLVLGQPRPARRGRLDQPQTARPSHRPGSSTAPPRATACSPRRQQRAAHHRRPGQPPYPAQPDGPARTP